MRNPAWQRDELILALDLYFQLESGQIHARNPQIIGLSEILNKLPLIEHRPDVERFRNPNGVGLKLSNFLAIDPSYHGKGMERIGKLDREVFNEFENNKEELRLLASKIKHAIEKPELVKELAGIEDDEDKDYKVREGRTVYKLHKLKERKPTINKKKKEQYFKRNGKLDCEVCEFDFFKVYGELGKGFIECHHRVPLHKIDGETTTSLDDLALVCSNCHEMLHKGISELSIEDLKSIIKHE